MNRNLAIKLGAIVLLIVLLLLMLMLMLMLMLLLWSGQLLSELALYVPPAGFWEALTGVSGAGENPAVQWFLQLCVALAQLALLPALGLYRLWYRS
jgi:hypothetical protein